GSPQSFRAFPPGALTTIAERIRTDGHSDIGSWKPVTARHGYSSRYGGSGFTDSRKFGGMAESARWTSRITTATRIPTRNGDGGTMVGNERSRVFVIHDNGQLDFSNIFGILSEDEFLTTEEL